MGIGASPDGRCRGPHPRSPGPEPGTFQFIADLRIPQPPTFATVEEERLHRKQRLAAAFRLFAHFGYEEVMR
ncbi:MAG: hypothetical protein ACREMX_11665, partial [Gemmatimonadales bacterium]